MLDFKSLFESLPNILSLFVPGFVFIKTLGYFSKLKAYSFEGVTVTSVTISYVLNLFVESSLRIFNRPDISTEIISTIIAFVFAIIVVKFKTSGCHKSLLKWLGKVTDSEYIWQDIFDRNKGSRIRCYSNFKHKDAMIEGDVKYFEICEDGECSIALINYVVTYDNKKEYRLGERTDEPILYINTRNIHGLEVTHGK